MSDKVAEVMGAMGNMADRIWGLPDPSLRCDDCGEGFLFWATFFEHQITCPKRKPKAGAP